MAAVPERNRRDIAFWANGNERRSNFSKFPPVVSTYSADRIPSNHALLLRPFEESEAKRRSHIHCRQYRVYTIALLMWIMRQTARLVRGAKYLLGNYSWHEG